MTSWTCLTIIPSILHRENSKVEHFVTHRNPQRCAYMTSPLPCDPIYSTNSILILKTRGPSVLVHFQMEEFQKLYITRDILAPRHIVAWSSYQVTKSIMKPCSSITKSEFPRNFNFLNHQERSSSSTRIPSKHMNLNHNKRRATEQEKNL